MLRPVEFPGFAGGINLRDQPNQVDPTQAIDLLNVTFSERGAVKSRDGYSKFTSSALTNRVDSMTPFYTTGGTAQILCGAGNRLDAVNTAGGVVASSTAPTANPHFFARFGGPTAQLVYAANGTDQLRTWDGAAYAVPAWTGTAPTGRFVAVTPWDNRLVNARRAGAVAGDNASTVRFSDAGVPGTWGANNFVDVTPGDGEEIQGVIAWQQYVFVFKQTKFFRFHGTSVSGSTPVFNYVPFDYGVGLASPRALAAGRDGVYFLSERGIYRTGGGPPELMSPLLDPLFYTGVSDFYSGSTFNQAQITKAAMAFHREQIFVAIPTGTASANTTMLVLDPRYGWWSIYDMPGAAMASFKVSGQPDLIFAYASGTNDLGRHTPGQTTDAGTTIPSRWRSGWLDLGQHTRKTVRETVVWGKGLVVVSASADFGALTSQQLLSLGVSTDLWADGTNSSDKWADGSNPSDKWSAGVRLMPGVNRQALRGSVFSFQLRNQDATPWAAYRMTLRLRETTAARAY